MDRQGVKAILKDTKKNGFNLTEVMEVQMLVIQHPNKIHNHRLKIS